MSAKSRFALPDGFTDEDGFFMPDPERRYLWRRIPLSDLEHELEDIAVDSWHGASFPYSRPEVVLRFNCPHGEDAFAWIREYKLPRSDRQCLLAQDAALQSDNPFS